MFVVGVGSKAGDDTNGDEEGDADGLPEGKEKDAFDAKEFWDGTLRGEPGDVGWTRETTHRKGFRSSWTHIQNTARHQSARHIEMLYTMETYRYPLRARKSPSW